MNQSKSQKLVVFVYLLLAIATAVCFWQVRNFDFLNYDDGSYITENAHVINGFTRENVIWAFTTGHQANWHPLTWLSLMLDCQLFGPNPGKMHLVNVLMHIANTLLLFGLFKKMTGSLLPAAFLAAVFAIHPAHVESVVWITERKDMLSTLFLLLTLLSYVSYVKQPTKIRYILTLGFFAFGLMAKPMLVTLPFVLLLLDYWPLNRFDTPQTVNCSRRKIPVSAPVYRWREILIEKIPFIMLSAVSSVITFFVQRSAGAVVDIGELPLRGRVANVFLSYARYIGKMFWPQNLTVCYPFDVGEFPFWQIVFYALLLIMISVFVIGFASKHKYLPVGWFWFVITLIPVIGLVQVGDRALADRYTYISYIGLCIMIAWGLPELIVRWRYRKIALGVFMLIVLTMLGICTYREVTYWNNSTTLFSRALEVTKDNYLAHFNLGQAFYKKGNNSLAIEHYKKALEILPECPGAAFSIGCILADQNDLNQAIEYFQKAIQLDPQSASSYNSLGVALVKQGRLDKAVACFTKVVQLKPDFAEAHHNLAKTLVLQGKFNEACDQFRTALHFQPDSTELMGRLAGLIVTHPEIKGRDVNEAVRLAKRACELTSYKDAALLGNLAVTYASAGKFAEAVDIDKTALKFNPNSASLYRNLGYALSSQQKFKEAIWHINRSLEIEPNNLRAQNDLAWILATNPDPNIRNAADAIRISQQICKATNYLDPVLLDTLGAAYASADRFSEAVDIAQKALKLADANNIDLFQMIESHLDLYKASRPYIGIHR